MSRIMSDDASLYTPLLLLLSALALSGAAARHPQHRGLALWQLALWGTCAGAALAVLAPNNALWGWLAQALLLQWPVLLLAGLRRFNSRVGLPASLRCDFAMLALAALAPALAQLWPQYETLAWGAAAATAGLHLYVAAVIFLGPGGRESTPLMALGATIALAGLLPALAILPPGDAMAWRHAQAQATGPAGVVMAFVVMTLLYERTEQQLRASRRRLRTLANLDPLTQLSNRRHFHEMAERALRSDRDGTAVLLIFDIDHFKHVNDHLGHAAGDRALRLVSRCMLEHLRMQDVAGRYGGDEFVLLLRQSDLRQAMGAAARIVGAVQSGALPQRLPRLSLSFGVVQVAPQEALADALRRADQALYEAKRQGRSRVVAAVGDEARPIFRESQRLGLIS